jgi:acetyl-CoA carboxylase carboxyltransferase component
MGAEGAVNVLFRKDLAAASDPAALRSQLMREYASELVHPYYAAERGLVDDVIDPAQTRSVVANALAMLRDKRKQRPARKHGNVPL